MRVTKEERAMLALGASLRATGGGIARKEQEARLLALPAEVELIDISSLGDEGFVCTTYDLAASNGAGASSESVRQAIVNLEKAVGQQCIGIFPGETGVECLAFEAAALLGVPVVDADSTGGRAVPSMSIDNFVLHRMTTLPVSYSTESTSGVYYEGELEALEKNLRVLGRGIEAVAVADHAIRSSRARSVLSLGAISRSIKSGYALDRYQKKGSLGELLFELDARLLSEGMIQQVVPGTSSHFFQREIILDDRGSTRISVVNEILKVSTSDDLVAAPRLLCAIDSKTGLPLHVQDMQEGIELLVLELPCEPRWDTDNGRKLFREFLRNNKPSTHP